METQISQKSRTGLPDLANATLTDVIDIPALQDMMNDYHALTGIGVGIIDLNGTVLVGTGWQDICVRFHRARAESCAFCLESDIMLSRGVLPGTFKEYRCKNNMWDIATPIMLGERHIGNIFLGQFLYDDETPDYELFRAQARRFGYDEADYLAALDRVPRYSRETVQKAMGFYSKLATMISRSNYTNAILADTLARREQAEETLRESEEKFAKTFSAAPSLLVISTLAEGRYIDVNETFERYTGYRREEAIGRTSLELNIWTAETRERFVRLLVNKGSVRDFEADFRSKEGKHLLGLVSAEIVEIKGEKCLIVLVNDITGRKRAEESLWLMTHVFHASIAANSIADLDGIISECNDAFLKAWGYQSREEVIGRHIADFFIDAAEAVAILAALNRDGLWEGEFAALKGDGAAFVAYGMASEVKNNDGALICYQSSCLDITGRKQAEEELLQAKTEAEAANVAKSRFLATMSHEIRTPMNGVIGMIQLLQQTGLTAEQHDYAEIACKSGFELVHLLNDILELSRIEADRLELELLDFNLRAEIDDTINLLTLAAREKALQLSLSMESDVPLALKGDAGRLRQIIINIVGNAIKFTPKGSVLLHVSKAREDAHSVILRFRISDSGIGIPAGKLEHIFDPFTQVDSSTTRKFGGTGLGLAICKRLTGLMGGDIGVESVEGVGSTFWFTVKLEKPVEAVSASPQPVHPLLPAAVEGDAGGRIRLLLAEDDPAGQQLLRLMLGRHGYEVDVVGNGREALHALEHTDYALVLMDCMMPEMNGYEATAVIRDPASPVRRHDIPVIALTGNAMKDDRGRCLAAGMNDYLAKPFVFKELYAKLEALLKSKGG